MINTNSYDAILYPGLLKKFITHIAWCEGITYTTDIELKESNVKFTEKEIKILQDIACEIQYYIKTTNNMKTKKHIKFDKIFFYNRWRKSAYLRDYSWVIIGIGKKYFSSDGIEYYISFFGVELKIWFTVN